MICGAPTARGRPCRRRPDDSGRCTYHAGAAPMERPEPSPLPAPDDALAVNLWLSALWIGLVGRAVDSGSLSMRLLTDARASLLQLSAERRAITRPVADPAADPLARMHALLDALETA